MDKIKTIKSNIDFGDPTPFDTNNQTSVKESTTQISGLNMGQKSNVVTPISFSDTDFANSDFHNDKQGSGNNLSKKTDDNNSLIKSGNYNNENAFNIIQGNNVPDDLQFTKHHHESPKKHEKDSFGEFGEDFPKGPDFKLGGNYDWNYYSKLENVDVEKKIEILRKVGC